MIFLGLSFMVRSDLMRLDRFECSLFLSCFKIIIFFNFILENCVG
jgi:hypothetical protein